MGHYSAISLIEARAALAARLDDVSMVHWVSDELDRYLNEAQRTWNAFTGGYRQSAVFNTTANQVFYDLPTVIPAQRAYTVTNRDLVLDLEAALMEPATTGWPTWDGSQQFTMTDLTDALTRRRDQFLRETSAVLTRQEIDVVPVPGGRVSVPDTTLTIRRVGWRQSSGRITGLRRDDEWGSTSYHPRWVQQVRRVPLAYAVATDPPLALQILPPHTEAARLDLVSVAAGADLTVASATVAGIPDDWAWVVKFGALADLLARDGLAFDPLRAAYCESRYQHGVALARTAAVVLTARINDVTIQLGSLNDADTYSPFWQSPPAAQPRRLLLAGHNLIASWPPPSTPSFAPSWSIIVDVVANVPELTGPGTQLQIDASAVDPVLDYAQHLALFKEGAAYIDASRPLLDRFLRYCSVDLIHQQAAQPARGPLHQQTMQDLHAVADELPPVTPTP